MIEKASGRVIQVTTPNMMTQVVVKRAVPRPAAYAIPAPAAGAFAALLERHAIPFERLSAPREIRAERCRLLRVDEDFDPMYDRYEGTQSIERKPAAPLTLPAGSLVVPLTGEPARRAVLVLEPTMVYGLHQYPTYRALVDAEGICPVVRVVEPWSRGP